MRTKRTILRTPLKNFKNLPNFNFRSRFINTLAGYQDLRLHFIDEGNKNSERIVICLHGQPTWSYIYRKMIPVFVKAGQRVLAPDFFGFGKSDKPIEDNLYTFNFHRNMLISFIETLPPKPITLVVQDWGGIIGLTLPVDYPSQIDRLIIMNTALGLGQAISAGFNNWQKWVSENQNFAISRLMKRACPHLSAEELKAYDAPFPDSRYRAGVRRFPIIMPIKANMEGVKISQKAEFFIKNKWKGKCFIGIGMKDPVFGAPVMKSIEELFHTQATTQFFNDAGHFLQEWGTSVAESALDIFND